MGLKRNSLGKIIRMAGKLMRVCCGCGCVCVPASGCAPDCSCIYCTGSECMPTKATLWIRLSALNGCYALGDGTYLRVLFSNESATICLKPAGACSLAMTIGRPGNCDCLGTFRRFDTLAHCGSGFIGDLGVPLGSLTFRLTKISATQWLFTVNFGSITLFTDTWTVASGNCNAARSGGDYEIIPCFCYTTAPPTFGFPTLFNVSLAGGVGRTCQGDAGKWGTLSNTGAGTYVQPAGISDYRALRGEGEPCELIDPPVLGTIFDDPECTTITNPIDICPRTQLTIGLSVTGCGSCEAGLYRFHIEAYVKGSGGSIMNPGGIMIGTAFASSPWDTVRIYDDGNFGTTLAWCDGMFATVSAIS